MTNWGKIISCPKCCAGNPSDVNICLRCNANIKETLDELNLIRQQTIIKQKEDALAIKNKARKIEKVFQHNTFGELEFIDNSYFKANYFHHGFNKNIEITIESEIYDPTDKQLLRLIPFAEEMSSKLDHNLDEECRKHIANELSAAIHQQSVGNEFDDTNKIQDGLELTAIGISENCMVLSYNYKSILDVKSITIQLNKNLKIKNTEYD